MLFAIGIILFAVCGIGAMVADMCGNPKLMRVLGAFGFAGFGLITLSLALLMMPFMP